MTNVEKLTNVLLSTNAKIDFHKLQCDDAFNSWLIELLPEIVDCEKCNQNTPWHIYNVLDHILVSVEEINKLTQTFDRQTRKMFAYVMFFHDMGKPKCRQIKQFQGMQVDSFKGHNIESEKIAKLTLSNFGFNKQEVEHMSLLILNHDLLMKIVKNPTRPDQQKFSKELVENLAKKFGEKTLGEIVLISTADNNAQNPKLTKEPLKILQQTKLCLENIKNHEK